MNKPFVFARRRVQRFVSDPSAAAALEFAILAPMFIALMFGVIVLGWAFYTMSTMNYVAEKVGRVLFLNPGMSSSEVEERVATDLAYLDRSALTVDVSFETASGGYRIGRAVVSYEFSIEIPLAGTYPWLHTTTVSIPLGSS